MEVKLIPREDGARLLPVHAEYDEDGTKHVFIDEWPRLVLLDEMIVHCAPYVSWLGDGKIRFTVENGSGVYRFIRREGDSPISLYEGLE